MKGERSKEAGWRQVRIKLRSRAKDTSGEKKVDRGGERKEIRRVLREKTEGRR